jgi:hypothetical protein
LLDLELLVMLAEEKPEITRLVGVADVTLPLAKPVLPEPPNPGRRPPVAPPGRPPGNPPAGLPDAPLGRAPPPKPPAPPAPPALHLPAVG